MNISIGMPISISPLVGRSEHSGPRIRISSGSGYAGSVLTSTQADQWTVDGVAIDGETEAAFTMTTALEGRSIRCGSSNAIRMWMPTDLDNALKAVWLDPKRAQSVQDGKVTGWPDQFGHTDFTQEIASRQPAAAVLGGYAAAVWPEGGAFVSLQSLEALSVGWWAVVLQYKDGMAETFDNYDPIIGNGLKTSNGRILGELGASKLFLSAVTDQVSINGGENTDTILPRPKAMVSFEWTTAADLWGLGLSNFPSSSAERKWRGPMFEALALRTRPTGDALDRITACMMHRNGLSGQIPTANPYKTTGPLR